MEERSDVHIYNLDSNFATEGDKMKNNMILKSQWTDNELLGNQT